MIFKIFEFECWLCLSPLRSKHHGEEFCTVRFKDPLYIWQSLNWTRGLGLLLVCGRGHAYIWRRIYLGEIKEYGYHGFWCVKNSNGSFIVVLDRKSMLWKKLNNYIQKKHFCAKTVAFEFYLPFYTLSLTLTIKQVFMFIYFFSHCCALKKCLVCM